MARFATIGPVKAGWLVKSKGHWYVTEEGKKAYNQIQDPHNSTEKREGCIYNGGQANRKQSPNSKREALKERAR